MPSEPRPMTRLASLTEVRLSLSEGIAMRGSATNRSFAEAGLPQVIPVIDVRAGQAVRAIQGRRSEYQPLESVLVRGSQPDDLARALVERYAFEEIYVADLDALLGGPTQFDLLRRVAELPVRILLDLGIGHPEDVERARRELPSADVCFVLATEASPDAETFRSCLSAFQDPSHAALGLDFYRGTFRTKGIQDSSEPGHGSAVPNAWIAASLQAGMETVLALDLDSVGSDRGFAWPDGLVDVTGFREFRRKIGGGGIRSAEDVRAAGAAGCDAVLVGSALHDGRIAATSISGPT